jgi:DNA-directed RNA polymerase specialized sigma24 family protein
MELDPSTRPGRAVSFEPEGLRAVTFKSKDYFIRLLAERHGIRAALENPGGSVILTNVASKTETEASQQYSSMLGSDIHLDLIDAEAVVDSLPGDQRKALLQWVDGLSSREAALYSNVKPRAIRARKQQAIEIATERWEEKQLA